MSTTTILVADENDANQVNSISNSVSSSSTSWVVLTAGSSARQLSRSRSR
jgi:microcompartment protein CcmK/EutM